MHSNFAVLIKEVKPSTYEDETLIKRAKSRYAYWAKGDTVIYIIFFCCMIQYNTFKQTLMNNFPIQVRCCTYDRKRSTQPKPYVLPSCWPTLMPSDMEKLNMQFSKL